MRRNIERPRCHRKTAEEISSNKAARLPMMCRCYGAAAKAATAADYMRFLFAWQHVRPGTALQGRGGLAQVIAQLQGCEIAAGAWEREVLPARVGGYDSAWLDGLCLSGELAWGRLAPREAALAPTRAAPIAIVRRRDLAWLLVPGDTDPDGDAGLSAPARDVLRFLREAGASFLDDLIQGARRLRSEAEDALWELVTAGRVTGDGFAGLRALISATQTRGGARARWHARWSRRGGAPVGSGRWALLRAPQPPPEEDDARSAGSPVHQAIRRGLPRPPGARAARPGVARSGARLPPPGDARRAARRPPGRRLRRRAVRRPRGSRIAARIRREPPRGEIVRISACDPLNLVGIVTPGPRVPATLTNSVLFRDGVPQLGADEAPASVAALACPRLARRRAPTSRISANAFQLTPGTRRPALLNSPDLDVQVLAVLARAGSRVSRGTAQDRLDSLAHQRDPEWNRDGSCAGELRLNRSPCGSRRRSACAGRRRDRAGAPSAWHAAASGNWPRGASTSYQRAGSGAIRRTRSGCAAGATRPAP